MLRGLALLFALGGASGSAAKTSVAIKCTTATPPFSCAVAAPTEKAWTARATLWPSFNVTGWGELAVEGAASPAHEPAVTYAAGYAEAYLTAEQINLAQQNGAGRRSPSAKVRAFIDANNAWVRGHCDSGGKEGYWRAVCLVYAQLDGLVDGYNAARGGLNALTSFEVQLLGMTVELDDIATAVDPSSRPDWREMSAGQLASWVHRHTHCSAMIQLSADYGELLSTHNTWGSYADMLRLWKTYTLPFAHAKASTVTFPGYPASLAGIDDYYITSQRLVVIETTNTVFNTSIFAAVRPDSTVPYWVRVIVANQLAETGAEWHDNFYLHNSGTYNNQWMTVDYKRFEPHRPLPEGTFIVSEQIPGYHHVEDQTRSLSRGHWPSYNVPFYEEVYERSGYPAVVAAKGAEHSYDLAPRASIFRRDAARSQGTGAEADLAAFKHFSRLNRFNVSGPWGPGGKAGLDPLFPSPYHAIAARGDRLPTPEFDGSVDSKVTNAAMVRALTSAAVAGPTSVATGEDQPVFEWTGPFAPQANFPHYGHPTRFDFGWVEFSARQP